MGVFQIFSAFLILISAAGIKCAEAASPQNKQTHGDLGSQNNPAAKKTGGIRGDPSLKRGFDLGYDVGPRAAQEDRIQNKIPNPFLRPEYTKPDHLYRYEYGSRAAFVAGFRRGFLLGYRSSFGGTNIKGAAAIRVGKSVEPSRVQKARIDNLKIREIPVKKNNLAGDAL